MIIVLMGVSGSGKTTIGTLLAQRLPCRFLDADALHPDENIERMRRGVPLTDDDRGPWLAEVHRRLLDADRDGQCLVVACSALKRSYRARLADGLRITWVFLEDRDAVVRERIERRTGHFMRADMLESQIAALEEPADAIVPDITQGPEAVVEEIRSALLHARSVHAFHDVNALSTALAAAIASDIERTVRTTGRCSLVLAGGTTPRKLYEVLASEYAAQVPWSRVHVFWGDERYVPADDDRSNHRMARETLLDHVPCPPENIHPMPTHYADPHAAADAYEATLRDCFDGPWPRFDLVLLGMGEDGHTASLFPGSPALDEPRRWSVAAVAPAEPSTRLTLTLPVLNRSLRIHFIAAGGGKAPAVRKVLSGTADRHVYPAAGVQPHHGSVTWWLDREAAAESA
jgi:6-phosphogluconolactonase